uniref:Immunoglobulin V-set domain-containing protein n=1 Tax=Anas platyrhynchos TaxID=8839 RepID=A0A8B9TG84_ANAPL
MRQGRAAGLAALPWAHTTEGTGINIACSHPNIQSNDYIYWYRQFPGQGPAFLVWAKSGSKDVTDPAGRLSVAGDRRSSALWLARPRLRDAAVYYCGDSVGHKWALENAGRLEKGSEPHDGAKKQ